MAIYKLDIDKKFGQYHLRLSPQADKSAELSSTAKDVRGLIANLDAALAGLDLRVNGDTVIFRQIEYDDSTNLRETVRFSRY
jgi:hypothetical protein